MVQVLPSTDTALQMAKPDTFLMLPGGEAGSERPAGVHQRRVVDERRSVHPLQRHHRPGQQIT